VSIVNLKVIACAAYFLVISDKTILACELT